MQTLKTGGPDAAANEQTLAAGMEVGEYRVEAVIGKGGFGTVYRAAHPLIGKLVAIKVLARRYSADPEVVERFVREARAVNQIRHHNIIDIFSFGHLPDGRHYYVMEYLDGETLEACLRRDGAMPLATALPILRAIAKALDAAHAKDIAHRDLKPDNVFLAVDADGVRYPKLLDFGIAKLLAPEDDVRHKTGTGVPIGTPYYMSPEQSRGRAVDHRTDIYSFGVLAYRTLTARHPFDGDDYMELLLKHINEEPPPPSSHNAELGPAVDAAIAWMMAKDPAKRPPLVIDGVNALEPGAKATTQPPPTATTSKKPAVVAIEPGADALAATSAQLAPPSTPATLAPVAAAKRARAPLWIGAALVLVAGAAGVFVVLPRGAHDPGEVGHGNDVPRSNAGSGSAATAVLGTTPPDPADANTPVAPPVMVKLTITGTPPHTKIFLDGKELIGHEAPGVIELVKSTAPIAVTLENTGYKKEQPITPSEDRELKLDPAAAPPRPHNVQHTPDHNAVERPAGFGGGN